jgi:hypothetical protein
MGSKFWDGMRWWGQEMMKEGVFAREEIGFGYITDSPKDRGPHRTQHATVGAGTVEAVAAAQEEP